MDPNLVQSFQKDEVIFREGDAPGNMFIIHAGKVRIVKAMRNRLETLSVIERGEFFGEMSILEKLTRNATALAVEDGTQLISIDAEKLESLLKDNIEIAMRMIRKYSTRLRSTTKKLESLMRDKEELDTGILEILSHVRKRPDSEDEGREGSFGYLTHTKSDKKYYLARPEVLIGRKDPITKLMPDLDLTPIDESRTVSRKHARIALIDDAVFLSEEPGVVNGTTLNGKQVPSSTVVEVVTKDKIQIGNILFKLHIDL